MRLRILKQPRDESDQQVDVAGTPTLDPDRGANCREQDSGIAGKGALKPGCTRGRSHREVPVSGDPYTWCRS